jgi:hypothetical protein
VCFHFRLLETCRRSTLPTMFHQLPDSDENGLIVVSAQICVKPSPKGTRMSERRAERMLLKIELSGSDGCPKAMPSTPQPYVFRLLRKENVCNRSAEGN